MSVPNDINSLIEKDRILMAAWMLPNDGPLTDGQRAQTMENFRLYLKRTGITLDQVAHQLGSPRRTTIQELIDGNYRKNADANIRKLNMWVEQHARQQAASLTDKFVTTKVAKAFLNVTRLVCENGTMGLVIGPTGIGKSRCAQAAHETYVGSVYLRIINGYHHPRGLTHALAAPLGVRDSRACVRGGHHESELERVIAILRDSSRLLILDEAQKLTDDALELLRDIHDSTGVPILLLATKDLHDRIQRAVGPDHGQTYSRYDIIHHLTQGKDAFSGGKPLFTIAEIKELYSVSPIRLSPDAAQYLQGVANQLGYGSLRRCKILLRNAARRARKRQNLGDDQPVTVIADDLEWVETRLRQEATEQNVVLESRQRVLEKTGT
jgi:DNA transposition AAA+ family ATPase